MGCEPQFSLASGKSPPTWMNCEKSESNGWRAFMWIVKSSGASLPDRTEVDSLLHVMVWSEQIALSKALAIVCSLQSFPGLISSAPATFQTFSTENSYIEPRYLLYKPDRIPHKKTLTFSIHKKHWNQNLEKWLQFYCLFHFHRMLWLCLWIGRS